MASLSMEIVPFAVPDEVTLKMPPGRRQDGMKPAVTIPLEQLSSDALDSLLEEFVAAVQLKAKAGKAQG